MPVIIKKSPIFSGFKKLQLHVKTIISAYPIDFFIVGKLNHIKFKIAA